MLFSRMCGLKSSTETIDDAPHLEIKCPNVAGGRGGEEDEGDETVRCTATVTSVSIRSVHQMERFANRNDRIVCPPNEAITICHNLFHQNQTT